VKKKYEEENFVDTSKAVWNYSILTEDDVTNYQNGTHYTLYKKFGSHSIQVNDVWGVYFLCMGAKRKFGFCKREF
jgi:1,4-alpha-glucan branching enzyme